MATKLEKELGKAIQLQCSMCCLGLSQDVNTCEIDYCHLHKYRLGIDNIDENSGKDNNVKITVRSETDA